MENPTLIPPPTEKEDPDPLVEDSDPLVARSVHRGQGFLFQWDVGISVGFSKETTGSLRNPKTWRTPSYGNHAGFRGDVFHP